MIEMQWVATTRLLCCGLLHVGGIALDRAWRHARVVQGKVIIAGPEPDFGAFPGLFRQTFSRRVPVHNREPLAEFLSVSHK